MIHYVEYVQGAEHGRLYVAYQFLRSVVGTGCVERLVDVVEEEGFCALATVGAALLLQLQEEEGRLKTKKSARMQRPACRIVRPRVFVGVFLVFACSE